MTGILVSTPRVCVVRAVPLHNVLQEKQACEFVTVGLLQRAFKANALTYKQERAWVQVTRAFGINRPASHAERQKAHRQCWPAGEMHLENHTQSTTCSTTKLCAHDIIPAQHSNSDKQSG
jgi:hypothetical protein